MKVRTHISEALREAGDMAQYDAEVKKILSNKTILAWILKGTVAELKNGSIEQIRECIEGEPQVSRIRVRPGHTPEAISGSNKEDKVPGEGTVTYDIRFYVILPEGRRIKLIMDIEAQKSFYPGYDLVTRGVFYCNRMLSSQLDVEFTGENYNDIKKVYSIFICMEAPKYVRNTITEYNMRQIKRFGNFKKKVRYDLLSLVMICMGEDEHTPNPLLGMLNVLLSDTIPVWKKEEILSNKYGLEMEIELKEAVKKMCNLSELVLERGIKEGRKQGRESGLREGRKSGLREGRKSGLREGRKCGIEEGRILTLYDLVEDETLALTAAAERLSMSEEEFMDKVNRYKKKK
ncbi:MAG: hypothetical protein IJP31_11260 [Lachnospiraceae bacterium]|nr:hypothetical protein [Lachnospiraceae bacterium]